MENTNKQEMLNLNLLDLWQVVVKRRYIIGGIFLVVTTLTLIYSLSMSPVYRATVQVLIESENPQVVKVDAVNAEDNRGQDYYQTQYKVLESRAIARDVIRKLSLENTTEFNYSPFIIGKLYSYIKGLFVDEIANDISDPLNPYIVNYLERLSIKPVPRSRLVDIGFEGNDRVLITRIANEHAKAYTNLTLSFRLSGSKDAAVWLTGQTETLKSTLRISEEKLQAFTRQNDMLALESMISTAQFTDNKGSQISDSRGSSEANFIAQKLAELNTQQSTIRAERIAAETLAKQIRGLSITPEMIESVPEISSNMLIQKLKGDYVGLSRQLSDMREKYGDKHPKMVAIKDEMNSLSSKIKLEVLKIAKGVELQYEIAMAKERNLEKSLEELKKNASALNEKAIKYLELKGDVDLNRELYNKVLKRAKETALTSGLEATNVVVVDPAEIPVKPVKPQVVFYMFCAGILGLFLGVGTAFFVEYLEGTIENPEQFESIKGIECLGAIQTEDSMINSKDGIIENIIYDKGPFTESIRAIAANLLFSLSPAERSVVVVTSSTPEEGKTTISAMLAVVLSQMDRNVLLVDCDLRKPKNYKLFNISKEPGLSNLVMGQCEINAAMRSTNIDRLTVMPPGSEVNNPMMLIASKSMLSIIKELHDDVYDIVIIDSPPLISVSDAQIISSVADGTLIVVRASKTHKNLINKIVRDLVKANANIVGGVLNMVDIKKDKYYYGKYSRYYGYYDNKHEG